MFNARVSSCTAKTQNRERGRHNQFHQPGDEHARASHPSIRLRNELGFEWSLMELMPGVPLGKRWRKMSWVAKETIVRQLAGYQAQLFAKCFEKIGNLFPYENSQAEAPEGCQLWYRLFVLGRIVSLIFFWGDHATHDAPRGPFETSSKHDWLQARLSFVITDQDHILRLPTTRTISRTLRPRRTLRRG
jgi:hypothetical protein